MSSASSVRSSRDTLRASVLDAAIEFGIENQTMAKWIFEPVNEDEEEDELEDFKAPIVAAPQSLYRTPSEGSYQIVSYPPSLNYPIGGNGESELSHGSSHTAHGEPPSRNIRFGASSSSQSSHNNSAPDNSRTPASSKFNKLRKPRPDGYESDGGYVSDRAVAKKSKKKDKERKVSLEGEGKKKYSRDTVLDGEESDGGYLSEATAKRKKSFFRRNKSKAPPAERERPPMPNTLPVPHPIADRFASRSDTPNTFMSVSDSTRGSYSTDVPDTSRNVTPIPTHQARQDSLAMLTHAFKDDAQSIAGSVDWSTAYSHFPRAPPPPVPGSSTPPIPPKHSIEPPGYLRTKTRPSPLLLSPLPSDYGHASQASPVPSEIASITPDPKSTTTIRKTLLEAATSTPNMTWDGGRTAATTPSPIHITPSSDYVVDTPSPGGTVRTRLAQMSNQDLPPPSPPPSGPLPRRPMMPDSAGSKSSRLGAPPSPSASSPARSISPGFPIQRGRESPFPINPVTRVDERLQQRTAMLAEARNQPHPYAAGDRPQPGYRKLAPPEIYIDAASDDGQSIMSHPDVDSVLGVFKDYDGPMIETDSDPDDDAQTERSSVWTRGGFLDGERSGETRSRFVRNVEGMHSNVNGGRERDRGRVNGGLNSPMPPPRSILRNGVSTRT